MFTASTLRPMLATLPSQPPSLQDPSLVYEPKYDGIRAIVLVEPGTSGPRVRFWSRLGNEKTAQFPEIAAALADWGRALDAPVVLDGEIVALDAAGRPAGFQRLQGRIHVAVPGFRSAAPLLRPDQQPAAFIAFDLLRDGDEDLRPLPLTERRARLEKLFAQHPPPSTTLRLSEQAAGDGRELERRARREGWEGLLVKRAASPYRDGRRSPDWMKLKITRQDEFVVAGWTEPKGARLYFGSLILGAHDDNGRLVHVGDVGTGFSGAELERLWKMLRPAETSRCPFAVRPRTLGTPHWVTPRLVVQVRYTEMTDDGRLRHPVYLGLRDDKAPSEVKLPKRAAMPDTHRTTPRARTSSSSRGGARRTADDTSSPARTRSRARGAARRRTSDPLAAWAEHAEAMTRQLDELQEQRRDGRLDLPGGDTLDVTNLAKVFWPAEGYTKGDLIRYYARIAPLILPVVADRPLVMKRFPNGIRGEAFYQHRGPDVYPRGVRVEHVPGADVPTMFVGGDLKTLLYMAQLAAISQDPWFSRMQSLEHPDVVAIDLDPQPGADFRRIQDVALWVRDELERLEVPAFPKTSGSQGLHIYIPLPPGTSYQAGLLFCQIVATLVARKHPRVATVERMVKKRPARTVYVDYLQNIPGKTLACAYSARASEFAGVSAPLTWKEVDDDIAPQDFTIRTMEERVRRVGDLWADLRASAPADLGAALERLRA